MWKGKILEIWKYIYFWVSWRYHEILPSELNQAWLKQTGGVAMEIKQESNKLLTSGLGFSHIGANASLPAASGTTSHTLVVHPAKAKNKNHTDPFEMSNQSTNDDL